MITNTNQALFAKKPGCGLQEELDEDGNDEL